jgi:hypothetical protein
LAVDFSKAVAGPVDVQDVLEPNFVELKESCHLIARVMFCFECETVRADWSKEYRVKALADVFVYDLLYMFERLL